MKKNEYNQIYNEFSKNEKFRNLRNETHHGNNRLRHTERVAKTSFYMSKFIDCDSVSTVRGAFMHDFFLDSEFDNSHHLTTHPFIACKNAKEEFSVNEKEKEIIETHMYPITRNRPKSKEAVIVSVSDKVVSFYEFFAYQLRLSASVFTIFIIEMLKQF